MTRSCRKPCAPWSAACWAQIVATGGDLPGAHHFYITFKTGAPGVSIPPHLRERFPDEMTIVLQNKFWDLEVDDDGFTVGLTFNQMPAKLDIPFAAITAFVDPAVDFGLQFQAAVAGMEPEPHDDAENDSPELDGEAPVLESDDGFQCRDGGFRTQEVGAAAPRAILRDGEWLRDTRRRR